MNDSVAVPRLAVLVRLADNLRDGDDETECDAVVVGVADSIRDGEDETECDAEVVDVTLQERENDAAPLNDCVFE